MHFSLFYFCIEILLHRLASTQAWLCLSFGENTHRNWKSSNKRHINEFNFHSLNHWREDLLLDDWGEEKIFCLCLLSAGSLRWQLGGWRWFVPCFCLTPFLQLSTVRNHCKKCWSVYRDCWPGRRKPTQVCILTLVKCSVLDGTREQQLDWTIENMEARPSSPWLSVQN